MNNTKKYQTKQKQFVRNVFMSNPNDNFTIEKLMSNLSHNNTFVSKATLYRTLDSMVQNGEIMRYNIDNHHLCYQYKVCEGDSHIHFKCKKCGNILHVKIPNIIKISQNIEKIYGIEVDMSKTILYGLCERCKGEQEK